MKYLSQKGSTDSKSYGYHRAEILGAMISVLLIWALTAYLVYEAIQRIITPEKVDGEIMFIVAICGILVNIVMGFANFFLIFFLYVLFFQHFVFGAKSKKKCKKKKNSAILHQSGPWRRVPSKRDA